MIKKKVIVFASVILCIVIAFLVYDYIKERNIAENQKQLYISKQEGAASMFGLEIEGTDSEDYLLLSSTEISDGILDRWKAVSDAFPAIEFPTQELESEDWVGVADVFLRNEYQMEQETIQVIEELELENASYSGINYYISFFGGTFPEDKEFRRLLEENYLD